MTFEEWWVSEVGHPPSTDEERYAFRMARKAWIEGERKGLRRARFSVESSAAAIRTLENLCPSCKKDITQPRNPDGTDPAPCCNPKCGGIWGSSCYHCHLDGPEPTTEEKAPTP